MRYIEVTEETDTQIEVQAKNGSDIYGVIIDVLDLVRQYKKSVKFSLNNVSAVAEAKDTSAGLFDKFNEAYKAHAMACIEISRAEIRQQRG